MTKQYPTLWSSEVWEGDLMVLRSGFAIPIRETEWSTLQSPLGYAFWWFALDESQREAANQAMEDNKELMLYQMKKLSREYLGFAVGRKPKWSAGMVYVEGVSDI